MFLVVLSGTLRVGSVKELTREQEKRGEKIHLLRVSDMLGFQNLAETSGTFMEENWKYDVFAETDAKVAVLPFGEIKNEIRRQSSGMFKIMELAANKAFEVTYFNLMGMDQHRSIQFNAQSNLVKHVRDFFMKNELAKSFLRGMDKKDERVFI